MNPLVAVRERCAEVARRARHVAIDGAALRRLAQRIAATPPDPPVYDPAHHHRGDPHETLAFVLTLDAINFGSGWFPALDKLPGLSGYLTIATRLKQHYEREGPLSAEALCAERPEDVARLLGQRLASAPVAELMALFARALRELGGFLLREHAGRFEGPVEAASGRAAELVRVLCGMPLYADVSRYAELEVPFYKRAQITAADLALAFDGRGPGEFEDIDELTIFADNLVPHVLRVEGVLVYADALAGAIDSGALLPSGSEEEVEIRACALHAVECCAELLAREGTPIAARHLDWMLWTRGQSPEMKRRPRHRTRTCFY